VNPAAFSSVRCMRLTAPAVVSDKMMMILAILFCFCHVLFLLCFLSPPRIRRTKRCRSFVLPCIPFSSSGWWSHLTLVSSISSCWYGRSSRLRLQHIPSPSPTTHPTCITTQHWIHQLSLSFI
jgi:hypothetical protein